MWNWTNKALRLLLTSLMLGWCLGFVAKVASAEDLAVIVNKASPIGQLNRKQLVYIYMGRQKQYEGGAFMPLDMAEKSAERARFYRALMNKDLAEINAYWSRLLFSGRSTPPVTVPRITQLLETVVDNPGAIAYIPESRVSADVRVVYVLKDNGGY